MDPYAEFKQQQKAGWTHFAPLEQLTTPPAARLVCHAQVRAGQRVLDVACGTGVAAITAAQLGAQVTGIDLTPALLDRARENSALAATAIDWHEGDVENLPYPDSAFDVVLSQFGHMFAPRPDVAAAEMLRVLKPGGTLAFSTWPPELMTGRMFALTARYAPAPPPGVAPPGQWGVPETIVQRLGDAVADVVFDRATMLSPALTPAHFRSAVERTAGPLQRLVAELSASDPERLAQFRRELEALAAEFRADNLVRQDYLMTRARKRAIPA